MSSSGKDVSHGRTPVCILLSVYNGAAFLDGLLRSLQGQTYTDWRLVWRDDGSRDESRQILQRFASTLPEGQCWEVTQGGRHLGVARSFTLLLEEVPAGYFAAFCDQDDVWFPDKLERGVKALASTGDAQVPALYCSRQVLTDSGLERLGESPLLPENPSFLMALTQNIATGCTVVLSPTAVRLVQAGSPPPATTLHDWWSYLLVSGTGGVVVTDNVASLYYRQHQGNTVGAPTHFVARALAALRRGPTLFMSAFRGNINQLLALPHIVHGQNRAWLLDLQQALAVRGMAGWLVRYKMLQKMKQMHRTTFGEQLVFRLWFILGGAGLNSSSTPPINADT
jgi:glycosyltransferase involved in cell wall biosynthesis